MKWDLPMAFWDRGFGWDRPLFPISLRLIDMELFKVLLDFLYWNEPRFGMKAETIVTAVTTEPMLTLVPDPLPTAVPTRAAGLQALADYKAAAMLAEDGSKAAIADRKEKRTIMEEILKAWALYLELAAKNAGSIAILTQSGFDLRQPPQPVPQPLPAPELKVFRNGFSNEIHGRSKTVDGAVCYEGQVCTGTDTLEPNWRPAFFSSGVSKLTYDGLTPGQMYSFRLRALGRDGWSPWSDIAQLMAA